MARSDKESPGKIVRGCWAASLGDCSSQLSREHVISDAAIGDVVEFVTWTGRKQSIGRGSFTVPILCEHHNQALSPLDAAAAKLVRSIQEFRTTPIDQLLLSSGAPPEIRIVVDGRLFERWAVKTFVNMTVSSIGLGRDDLHPPVNLSGLQVVNYVFGRTDVCESVGLYLLDPQRTPIPPEERHKLHFRCAVVSDDVEFLAPYAKSEGTYRFPVYLYINLGGIEFGARANITDMSSEVWERIASPAPCATPLTTSQLRPSRIVANPSANLDSATPKYSALVIDFVW